MEFLCLVHLLIVIHLQCSNTTNILFAIWLVRPRRPPCVSGGCREDKLSLANDVSDVMCPQSQAKFQQTLDINSVITMQKEGVCKIWKIQRHRHQPLESENWCRPRWIPSLTSLSLGVRPFFGRKEIIVQKCCSS